jgi:hypothetical protein
LDKNVGDVEEKLIENALNVIHQRVGTIRICAAPVLQNGKYVEGSTFSDCLNSGSADTLLEKPVRALNDINAESIKQLERRIEELERRIKEHEK